MLKTHSTIRPRRSGFTLVEMLVATALVLLVMLMFAQIYSAAISTITDQKGLANNDSRARTIDTILRADLEKLTFRQTIDTDETRGIVPLAPGDSVDSNQRGYLYISENELTNDTDDVFQATIDTTLTERNTVEQFLYGKATALGVSRNEPDRDDGIIGNSLASSTAAEVAYFVRNGNLYRRVMLLRNPLGSRLDEPAYTSDPTTDDVSRTRLTQFYPDYSVGTGSFWNDYDFSACRVPDGAAPGGRLHFSGREDLDNSATSGTFPIAIPSRRFGHRPDGIPGEYDASTPTRLFMGRLTQEETSNTSVPFSYPGYWDGSTNPYNVTLNSSGVASTLAGGSRISEDLLLTHVSQFNIEAWDSLLQTWVNIGDGIGGYFDASNRTNTTYGPGGTGGNRVFDTWHPEVGITLPSLGAQPPYRPLRLSATYTWAQNDQPPVGALTYPSSGYQGFIYKMVRNGEDLDGNGTQDTDVQNPGTFDQGRTDATTEPIWPTSHGSQVTENSGTPNVIIWEAIDNRVGLEAIRFTIRFLDLGSGQERQLTIVHSFVE